MYNFLIVIGLLLIIIGLNVERSGDKVKIDIEENIYSRVMGDIEPVIESLVEFQEETYEGIQGKQSFDSVLESVEKPSYNEGTIKIIEQYELGTYTLEEACKVLNMKKGEVLLLRNIYKKFQS